MLPVASCQGAAGDPEPDSDDRPLALELAVHVLGGCWLAAAAEQRAEAAAEAAEAEVLRQSGASPAGGLRSLAAAAQAARVVGPGLEALAKAVARSRGVSEGLGT